jgi:hypothetical protein
MFRHVQTDNLSESRDQTVIDFARLMQAIICAITTWYHFIITTLHHFIITTLLWPLWPDNWNCIDGFLEIKRAFQTNKFNNVRQMFGYKEEATEPVCKVPPPPRALEITKIFIEHFIAAPRRDIFVRPLSPSMG